MTTPQLEMFFDGDCPLCLREVKLLRKMDRGRERILFTDIAAADFNPAEHGRTFEDFMAVMTGRQADGQYITGVEVFRQAYAAVGLGSIVSLTRLPGVSQALDAAYKQFAARRLKLTGRCDGDVCATPPPERRTEDAAAA